MLININIKRKEKCCFKSLCPDWEKKKWQMLLFCSFIFISLISSFPRLSSITVTPWCFIFPLCLVPNHLLQHLPFLLYKAHFSQFQGPWQISIRNIREFIFITFPSEYHQKKCVSGPWDKHPKIQAQLLSVIVRPFSM